MNKTNTCTQQKKKQDNFLLMWHIDPLLNKILETNKETRTVAMQCRDKHAYTTIVLLLETVFSTRSVHRGYKKGNWGGPVS
jgi:hypothetical protein